MCTNPPRLSAAAADEPAASCAVHHAIFAIDIIGYGQRPTALQPNLRAALYRLVEAAFTAVTLQLSGCRHEDRGDGILVILPATASPEPLLGPLAGHLHIGLRRYNQLASPAARLRVRTAVNAGYLRFDDHGVSGQALNELYRLLDANTYKTMITDYGAELALITSDRLYADLISDNIDMIDPDGYLPTTISHKETTSTAWIWLPPRAPHLTVSLITANERHKQSPTAG